MLFFWATGEPTLKAIAVNNLLVSGAMVTVLFIYYRDFADLVSSRKSLLAQQAATQALSDENFRLANLDSLTELPNRRRFFAELSSAFTDAERRRVRVAVGIIDLDGFKPINDRFGHACGDDILVAVSKRMLETVRDADTVARLGGDEFAILLTQLSHRDDADEASERVRESIEARPFAVPGGTVKLGASIGIAFAGDSLASSAALIAEADHAMYRIKSRRRGLTFQRPSAGA